MALAIEERVRNSFAAHLAVQGYVSAVDVLRGTGLLDESHYFDWVDGRVAVLESAISASSAKIAAALQAFEERGRSLNLRSREAVYLSTMRHPQRLRFTDDPTLAPLYALRYFSAAMSDTEIDGLLEKLSSPHELVVFEIIRDSKCSKCGRDIAAGDFIFMEAGSPNCLYCAELADLVYLGAGDRSLTRRARQLSRLSTVVLRFSRTRKRYERQGLLVETAALRTANAELSAKRIARTSRNDRRNESEDPAVVTEGDGAAPVYQLKVTLLGVTPPVWRRVLVPGSIDLPKLHRLIQRAMGWTNSHLHKFEFKEKSLSLEESIKKFFEPRPAARPKTLAGRVPQRGSKFRYIYDFGDEWTHDILVEKILRHSESTPPLPLCIDGQRACPPEDCGGAWGYEEILEAVADPKKLDHEERLDWLGSEFDPEYFSLKEANVRLKRIKC